MTKLGGRYLFRANRFTPSLNNHQAFDLPKEKKKIFSNTYLRKKKVSFGDLQKFLFVPFLH